MISLPNSDAHRIRRLFVAEHLSFVIEAMIAGHSPARIWVDGRVPETALIWDGAHCVYVAGQADKAGQWQEVFRHQIEQSAPSLIKLYVGEAAACEPTLRLPGYTLQRRERVLYRLDQPAKRIDPPQLPPGFTISEIGASFGELGALGNFEEVEAEIGSCWTSIEDFRTAGFGFCVHDSHSIACWCTAEYVSAGQCGIGIETVPECRRRGFATAATQAFLTHCAAHQITPHWDSWTENTPSVAVAESTGFRKIETYPILVASPDIQWPARYGGF
ncbi:MAG TPA: GNAT family N-acetyltransferase [Streptosporangiaceae bacterium]|nr:GNAT family N-acetyltransferase [Streptosporangiaceae bacterium]